MTRIFSFEREVHATLALMPLTVRRKLDLAGWKLSLEGWQGMSLADRRALADAEVEDEPSVAAFAAALREAADRVGASLRALPPTPPPWRTTAVPAPLRDELSAIGARVDDATWVGLDDDVRFTLLHLAKRRAPDRLRDALSELGLPVGPPG